MKITIFGAGYVGLVTGTCLAELGNDIILVDIDQDRVNSLQKGIVPIYEPGLSDLFKRNIDEKRLLFTTDSSKAINDSDIIFIAVGTPDNGDGSTNLDYVFDVAKTIGKNLNEYKIIVNKSTVPVGTGKKIEEIIKEINPNIQFDVVSNPEFLREGTAIRDFMVPDRIVIGANSEKAKKVLNGLYKGLARVDQPILNTTIESSEIIKYASNAMLALRISFVNELAPLCELFDADIKEVTKGMGLDKRLGSRFLQAGIGFGGSCFPKDVASLSHTLEENGLNNKIFRSILEVNEFQKEYFVNKIIKVLGNDLKCKNICVWGLAYKPKTDDFRGAPSKDIIKKLLDMGAKINAYDPEAMENAKLFFPEIEYHKNPYDCAKEADAILLLTEWSVFRNLDFKKVKESMRIPNLFDGRNIYDSDYKKELGFNYYGMGR